MECIFCKIVKGEIPASIVYNDSQFVAFLDIKPVNLGHVLLVPKKHSQDLFDMSGEDLSNAFPLVQKIAKAVKAATKADGVNIGMNNGPAAGQAVMHPHIHIMPRFKGDGHESWHGKDVPLDKVAAMASEIKKHL